ncbi:ribosomal protein L7/L12 [Microbacterium sp. LWO12-1.2]|uniref:ribosomal protein L7/L12 n=1 Tax=Microbacterium sp. LWO12-1.2 TaxID=3135261 RepID=UPI003434E8CD
MDIVWVVGIVIALIVVVIILNAAFKGMRPKAPEAQVYTPTAATPRSAPATSAMSTVSGLTPAVIAEIDRLVAAGQKINAIKVLREHSGLSLKDAKDRIDHWSASTTAPHLAAVSNAGAAYSSITPASATPSSVRAALPASVVADIDRLVAGNQQIAAIKLVREHTGLGLKESKNVIDAWGPHHIR